MWASEPHSHDKHKHHPGESTVSLCCSPPAGPPPPPPPPRRRLKIKKDTTGFMTEQEATGETSCHDGGALFTLSALNNQPSFLPGSFWAVSHRQTDGWIGPQKFSNLMQKQTFKRRLNLLILHALLKHCRKSVL